MKGNNMLYEEKFVVIEENVDFIFVISKEVIT